MNIYEKEDVTKVVTSVEDDILIFDAGNTIQRSIYVINDGANTVSYKIYGSPTGLKYGDKDNVGNEYSLTEIAKHWQDISVSGTVTSGAAVNIDLSSKAYLYFKLAANTSTGTATIRAFVQRIPMNR